MTVKEKAIYYRALAEIDEYIEEKINYAIERAKKAEERLSEYIKDFEAEGNIEESYQYEMLSSQKDEEYCTLRALEQIKKDIAKF